jgi:hypothetical protein
VGGRPRVPCCGRDCSFPRCLPSHACSHAPASPQRTTQPGPFAYRPAPAAYHAGRGTHAPHLHTPAAQQAEQGRSGPQPPSARAAVRGPVCAPFPGAGGTSTSTSASWASSTSRRPTCPGCCWPSACCWAPRRWWTCWAWPRVGRAPREPLSRPSPAPPHSAGCRIAWAAQISSPPRSPLRASLHPPAPWPRAPAPPGHVYYFLEDVYPRISGRRPLRTPALLRLLFPADEAVVVAPPAPPRPLAQAGAGPAGLAAGAGQAGGGGFPMPPVVPPPERQDAREGGAALAAGGPAGGWLAGEVGGGGGGELPGACGARRRGRLLRMEHGRGRRGFASAADVCAAARVVPARYRPRACRLRRLAPRAWARRAPYCWRGGTAALWQWLQRSPAQAVAPECVAGCAALSG